MKKLWMPIGVAVLLAAGCSNWRGPLTGLPIPDLSSESSLSRFDTCDDYLAWVKNAALDRVAPYGLDAPNAVGVAMPAIESSGRSAAGDATAAPSAAVSGPTTTTPAPDDHGTNVQERGVDEADATKSDGRRILAVRGGSLEVVSIDVNPPVVTASIDLGLLGGQILIDGDRVIVYGQSLTAPTGGDVVAEPADRPAPGDARVDVAVYSPTTEIVQVDLAAGRVVDRRTVDGTITAGRSANGTVRLVMSSGAQPSLGFVMPLTEEGKASAEDLNRSVIEESTIDEWIPMMTDAAGENRPLVDCAQMFHPATFAGFATLTVLSIPGNLDSMTATGLAADAQVTYASSARLYVATTQYAASEPPGTTPTEGTATETTDIHRFDIGSPGPAVYQGSGRIEGHLLNQYSMSESTDVLRVATTTRRIRTEPPMEPASPAETTTTIASPAEPSANTTTSGITVLALQGEVLVPVGRIDGLGPTEEIQAVRYLGDRAYVVTFRRTDPLYVIDLTDPTNPTPLGELKVNGFSSYLHPVGENRFLGVGTDADNSGRSTGGLISLYDTSDPTHPRELGRISHPGRHYSVSFDPHAFTWDSDAQVATITSQSFDGGEATGVSVADDQLREIGKIPLPGGTDGRTLVAADRLWALSWERLSAHDRSTLAELSSMSW